MSIHKICDTWGRVTSEEQSARGLLRLCIRNAVIAESYGGDIRAACDKYDRDVPSETPLSVSYNLLTAIQRSKVRKSVEHPVVAWTFSDCNGNVVQSSRDSEFNVLERLELGVFIGPASEVQIKRQSGDTAV